MTADQIINLMQKAIAMHGEYTFDDKGPSEVMSLEPIVASLNALPVQEAINTLEEVSRHDERARTLVIELLDLINESEECSDERWKTLMTEYLLSIYAGEF